LRHPQIHTSGFHPWPIEADIGIEPRSWSRIYINTVQKCRKSDFWLQITCTIIRILYAN